MNYLLLPPQQRRVRLRRDYHFGPDDSLYFPQPFQSDSRHLAAMLSPSRSPDHPFYYAWLTPSIDQFCFLNTSLGLGKLESVFLKGLTSLSQRVLREVPSDVDDSCLDSLATNLRRFLDRLEIPGTQEKVFIMVTQVQRCLLELNARSRWVGAEWRTRLKDAASHVRHPLAPVIGAFTENLNDLDLLFYAGVPVWYICTVESMPYVRIDSVVPFLQEDNSQCFIRPDGFIVDCTDASPPHKIIYDGLPNRPDRYHKMATFLDSLLSGSKGAQLYPNERSGSSHSRSRRLKVDNPKFSPCEYSALFQAKSFSPAFRFLDAKVKTTLPPISNTFMAPDSAFMPLPLQNWASAFRSLFDHNLARHPPAGLNPGYSLPPVRNILSPTKPETVRLLFHGWLRIRETILTRLNGPSMSLPSKQWRCLLEVAGWKYGHEDVATVTGRRHSDMRDLLKRFSNISSSDNEDFSLRPVSWRGASFAPSESLTVQVGQEVIWELQELGFRNDLIALDKRLDNSGMNAAERRGLLNSCWEGTASFVDIRVASQGLGAPTLQGRWPYLRTLHRVMRSWKGDKPELLLLNLPTDDGGPNFEAFLKRLEYTLASFYTTSFLEVFGRAACIPYQLA
jgi:hypothetical protein